jgi:hypothetical protein
MMGQPSRQTSCNRKRRKDALDRKRNKKQSILTEDEMKKNEKSVARHKRYLILKHKREAKRARTEISMTSQEIVESSSSERNETSHEIIESSGSETNETSYEIGESSSNETNATRQEIVDSSSSGTNVTSHDISESSDSETDETSQQIGGSSNNNENSLANVVVDSEIWNVGEPTFKCRYCNALLWYEERLGPNKRTKNPSFGICCKNGKIDLPESQEPPVFLEQLLNGDDQRSKNFRKNIRSYNSMFAFTSTGGVVDKEINKGHGPYVFRMHGQNYHHIGTLLPEEGNQPRWAQLYIYDTEHETENRISASKNDGEKSSIDQTIVAGLKKMFG